MSEKNELEQEKLEETSTEETKKKKKKDVIAELEGKCATLNEKYLYALAQMRDLHKTYEKENAIAIKYVTYDLMEELLPILDIFSMVLDNDNVPSEVKAYFKGFELVYNQFKQILDKHDVKEIKCNIGDPFDHNIHNGVEKVEVDEGEHDTIAQILQKGYKIGDKVLRPVSVKVFSLKNNEEITETEIEQEEATIDSEDKGE